MAGVIVRRILEHIDEAERPRAFTNREIKGFTTEELEQLLSRGILTRQVFSSTSIAHTEFSDNGERTVGLNETPPEPHYTIVVQRLIDAIRTDNGLAGQLRKSDRRYFELGEKIFRDLPPIRVCLSLLNHDSEWFDLVFQRVVRSPDEPAVLLIPRWIPISKNIVEQANSHSVLIRFLENCITSSSWELPWKDFRQNLKKAEEKNIQPRIPGEPISFPSGTLWKDVAIEMTDSEINIDVKGVGKRFSYQEAGFENLREKKPLKSWEMLNLLAIRGGVLNRDELAKDKAGRDTLKQQISDLRSKIKAVVRGIQDNPIPLDGSARCYRAAFQIFYKGQIKIPVPEETSWTDISIVEVESSILRITYPVIDLFAGSAYGSHREKKERRVEPAQQTRQLVRDVSLRILGLEDENGRTTPEGVALLNVLRNDGRVKRGSRDDAMLNLNKYLCDITGLEEPAVDLSRKGDVWTAKFDASSELGQSG
jgi:hypothetical protein